MLLGNTTLQYVGGFNYLVCVFYVGWGMCETGVSGHSPHLRNREFCWHR